MSEKMKTYVGIDNGVSGSIGIVPTDNSKVRFWHMPTRTHLNYTKQVRNVTRIDHASLYNILCKLRNPHVIMERPMVNPGRFQATASALRALEATLIVLEELDIKYQFIDSKEWQKVMLPAGIKGADKLKKASLDVGKRLFPQFKKDFKGDADGILIAEFARQMKW